jgi:hypothetical protein
MPEQISMAKQNRIIVGYAALMNTAPAGQSIRHVG